MTQFHIAAAATLAISLLSAAVVQDPLQVRRVVPPSAALNEGSSNHMMPLGSPGSRGMFLYGPEHAVTARTNRTVRILGMRFRPNGSVSSIPNAGYNNLRIDLSTAATTPATASLNFDDNHGADRTRVFDGNLTLVARTTGGYPSPFVLHVPFDVPFEWDPRCGALAMDIRVGGNSVVAAGSWDMHAGSEFRMLAASGNSATVATTSLSRALVTQLIVDTAFAPATAATTEGDSSSSGPWGSTHASYRVMDVYGANMLRNGGVDCRSRITALTWRIDELTHHPGATFNCRVSLSTTAADPANLSPTFDDNHGADKAVVRDGTLVMGPAYSGSGPRRFTFTCELDTPFEYTPSLGNLVVDVQVFSHDLTVAREVDAVTSGVNRGRVRANGSATATVASMNASNVAVLGLVTEPVPTVPDNRERVLGNASLREPFHEDASRAMMLYPAAAMATTRPVWIDHIAFRPNSSTSDFGPATWTCTIDLSESALATGPLYNTFDNNHGARRRRVFDGKFSVPYLADTSDPSQFPVSVKLDSAYYYDPASGPLIVDIRVTDRNGDTRALDSQGSAGLWRATHAGDPDAVTATGNSERGLVVRLGGSRGNALAEEYGAGCAGSNGTPRCFTDSLPRLPNPELNLLLRSGPTSSATFVMLGLTAASQPLDAFGMPGCVGLNNRELGNLLTFTDAAGDGALALALPDTPEIAGLQILQQWACLDPTANATGISFSNGQSLVTSY